MKSFETWLLEEVEITFSLTKQDDYPLLNEWLEAEYKPTQITDTLLNSYKISAQQSINSWNEDELKFHFIAPLIKLVDFTSSKYKLFTQRTLNATINGIEVGGRVDAMVATGKQIPKEPYFFLHEYKPSRRSTNNDPDGQLLISLVTAQSKNAYPHPIYGVTVEGRLWYFWVLKDKDFAVSNDYSVTSDEIFKIFAIICKAKEYIEMEVDKISKNK